MRHAALSVLVLVSVACTSTTEATAPPGPSFSPPPGAIEVNVATPARDVSWIAISGDEYMLFRTPDGYRLYGSASCAGEPPLKTSASTDGFAVLDCPDGSTWEMNADGESGGGGDAAANDPPPEWPVATASDGTLTAYVIPGYFPPGTGGSDVGAEPSTSGGADVGARLACEKVREMGLDIVFDPNAGDLRSIVATAASANDPELRRAADRFMVPQFYGLGPEPLGDIVTRCHALGY